MLLCHPHASLSAAVETRLSGMNRGTAFDGPLNIGSAWGDGLLRKCCPLQQAGHRTTHLFQSFIILHACHELPTSCLGRTSVTATLGTWWEMKMGRWVTARQAVAPALRGYPQVLPDTDLLLSTSLQNYWLMDESKETHRGGPCFH